MLASTLTMGPVKSQLAGAAVVNDVSILWCCNFLPVLGCLGHTYAAGRLKAVVCFAAYVSPTRGIATRMATRTASVGDTWGQLLAGKLPYCRTTIYK